MKIIYITSSFPFGNGETFLIPEIECLMSQGCEIIIFPMYARGSKRGDVKCTILKKPLVDVDILLKSITIMIINPFKTIRSITTLLSVKRGQALKNISTFFKALWLAWYAKSNRVNHIHSYWASVPASMAMSSSIYSNISWSFTAHRWDIYDDNLLCEKASRAAFVRFISKQGLAAAVEKGVPIEKTKLLHIGVKIPNEINYKELALNEEIIIACPGNLKKVKGHAFLLKALKELDKRYKMIIIGEGEEKKYLQERVVELNIEDRVVFIPHLEHEILLEYYETKKIHLVVLPSIDLGNGLHEGIPVVLMEAMAYGTPVISTSTGGIPELLSGGAGILVNEQNSHAIAEAIIKISENNILRKEIINKAQEIVKTEFNAIDNSKKLYGFFIKSI